MRLVNRALTISGVRGAVTLGAVLTIPLTLDDGTPFPGRDVVIVLAAGVILWSLISSSIGLPRVARKLVPMVAHWDSHHREEQEVRLKLARAAIDAVDGDVKRLTANATGEEVALINEAAASVTVPLLRVATSEDTGEDAAEHVRQALHFHHQLNMTAIAARRATLVKMLRAREIDDEIYRRLVHELDLRQASMPKL